MAIVLDGKSLALKIRQELKQKVEEQAVKPGLVVLLVGEDPASHIYVRNKERAANEVGFHSVVERLPGTTTQEELLEKIKTLNEDDAIQ